MNRSAAVPQGDQLSTQAARHLAGQCNQTLHQIRVPERHHHLGPGHIPPPKAEVRPRIFAAQ